jgi:hypothetical protein
LKSIGWIACAVLLVEDARIDQDDVAWETALRWIGSRHTGDPKPNWHSTAKMDRAIVFGAFNEKALL